MQDKSEDAPRTPQQQRAAQSKARGQAAEQAALQHLLGHGLTLLARNARFRAGELDLVMRDQTTIVFVEVRWRKSLLFGPPAATVNLRKQRRIIRAAQLWLAQNCPHMPACRFDVVAASPGRLEWLIGAFGQPELI